ILLESMYVGFSSATGLSSNYHYILGWSWNQSGKADLDLSKLPSIPRIKHSNQLTFVVLLIIVLQLFMFIVAAVWFLWSNKYEELLEPWEKEGVLPSTGFQ
ncbi:putative L-type lectin-domain containing receptor kinase I.5, partial [Bienertia sinuspersici]